MKIWIDLTSLPHIHFFRALIRRLGERGDEVLVTSREFGMMNDILDKNGIAYTSVGAHGGKDLEGKLLTSSERVIRLAGIMAREKPDIGLSKHSVESARVCFGLGIPSLNVIDHETAEAAMRLMVPLNDCIVTPQATPSSILRSFGARQVRTFYGVCETAHFLDFRPSAGVLKSLGLSRKRPIVLSRAEPMLSAHNDHASVLHPVLKEIGDRFDEADLVFIPRGDGDLAAFRDLGLIVPEKSTDTLSLYGMASLMVGAGSCMNREAAVAGCPTISICPDRLPAVDRFMISKGLMGHSLDKGEVVRMASEILEDPEGFRGKGSGIISGFEDPYKCIMAAMDDLGSRSMKRSQHSPEES